MTDWKLLLKNKRSTDQQIDDVGNIYQKSGGVVPKACQKCHQEFDAPTKQIPLKQTVPDFSCVDCDFKSTGAVGAIIHFQEHPDHKISKKSVEKTVGYENIIIGPKVMVEKIYKDNEVVDVNILCSNCFKLSKLHEKINDESQS